MMGVTSVTVQQSPRGEPYGPKHHLFTSNLRKRSHSQTHGQTDRHIEIRHSCNINVYVTAAVLFVSSQIL